MDRPGKISERGTALAKEALAQLKADPEFPRMHLSHLFNAMLANGANIQVQFVTGHHWVDVDAISDLSDAHRFLTA